MRNTVAGLILSLAAAAGLLAAEGAADATGYLAVPNASASPRTSRAIARIWHGRTVASKADAYEKYLNGTLEDYEYPAEAVAAALERLPNVPAS